MAGEDDLELLDDEDEDQGDDVDLGPLIQERAYTSQAAVAMMTLGFLLLLGGGYLAAFGIKGAPPGPGRVALGRAVGLGGLGLLVAGIAIRLRDEGRVQSLHERGVAERHRGGRVVAVRFDEADEVEYRSTQNYLNGAYTGTDDHLRLGAGGRSVVFERRRDERKERGPNWLEAMVDWVAGRVAKRMAGRLDRGESVPWTSRMVIHPDGVELVPGPFKLLDPRNWSGSRSTRFTWDQIDRVEVELGGFKLWALGQGRSQFAANTGGNNFLPGYKLVAAILKGEAPRPRRRPVGSKARAEPEPEPETRQAPARRQRPPEPKDLAKGERVNLQYTATLADLIALERYRRWKTPKGRKETLGTLLIFPAAVVGLTALISGRMALYGKIGPGLFLLYLAESVVAGAGLAWVLELLFADAARRRVADRAALDHNLAIVDRAVDPFRTVRMTLGPPGYGYKTDHGEVRRSWLEIARVGWDRGYIFIHKAADKVDPEAVDLMIPPSAFELDQSRAKDAFDRIAEWHRLKNEG